MRTVHIMHVLILAHTCTLDICEYMHFVRTSTESAENQETAEDGRAVVDCTNDLATSRAGCNHWR